MRIKDNGSSFADLVYKAAKKIPRGRVTSYGQIAQFIARPNSHRAVGNALNKNPFSPTVPCHRVVSRNGDVGGFAFGKNKKISLLKKEGVKVVDNKVVDFPNKFFSFSELG